MKITATIEFDDNLSQDAVEYLWKLAVDESWENYKREIVSQWPEWKRRMAGVV